MSMSEVLNERNLALRRREDDVRRLLAEITDLEAEVENKPPPAYSHYVQEEIDRKRQERADLFEQLQIERRGKAAFIANSYSLLSSIAGKIEDTERQEAKYVKNPPPAVDTRWCLSVLSTIEADRELVIRKLHAEILKKEELSDLKSKELARIQEKSRREIPLMAAKKDDEILQIKGAWERERKELTKEYDRLFQLNREQRFHLHRGTPIKEHIYDNHAKEVEKLKWVNATKDLEDEVKQLQREVDLAMQEKRDLATKYNALQISGEKGRKDCEDKKKTLERQLIDIRASTQHMIQEMDRYHQLTEAKEAELERYEEAKAKAKVDALIKAAEAKRAKSGAPVADGMRRKSSVRPDWNK